ncbi:MAG: hypothetical protein DRP42_00660 [Tenericutes bacterium]|nr:MAG: hypothetical protein DRP42_00660 [Mycoplasmatota bacterium]
MDQFLTSFGSELEKLAENGKTTGNYRGGAEDGPPPKSDWVATQTPPPAPPIAPAKKTTPRASSSSRRRRRLKKSVTPAAPTVRMSFSKNNRITPDGKGWESRGSSGTWTSHAGKPPPRVQSQISKGDFSPRSPQEHMTSAKNLFRGWDRKQIYDRHAGVVGDKAGQKQRFKQRRLKAVQESGSPADMQRVLKEQPGSSLSPKGKARHDRIRKETAARAAREKTTIFRQVNRDRGMGGGFH